METFKVTVPLEQGMVAGSPVRACLDEKTQLVALVTCADKDTVPPAELRAAGDACSVDTVGVLSEAHDGEAGTIIPIPANKTTTTDSMRARLNFLRPPRNGENNDSSRLGNLRVPRNGRRLVNIYAAPFSRFGRLWFDQLTLNHDGTQKRSWPIGPNDPKWSRRSDVLEGVGRPTGERSAVTPVKPRRLIRQRWAAIVERAIRERLDLDVLEEVLAREEAERTDLIGKVRQWAS